MAARGRDEEATVPNRTAAMSPRPRMQCLLQLDPQWDHALQTQGSRPAAWIKGFAQAPGDLETHTLLDWTALLLESWSECNSELCTLYREPDVLAARVCSALLE